MVREKDDIGRLTIQWVEIRGFHGELTFGVSNQPTGTHQWTYPAAGWIGTLIAGRMLEPKFDHKTLI